MKGVTANDLKSVYTADFETTGLTNYDRDGFVRVYLWSLVSLDGSRVYTGNNVSSFIKKLLELKARKVWFHNLRFDGSFIIDYLCRQGYEYGKHYTCIIDGMNIWYEIKLIHSNGECRIWDSLKKFPGQSVQSISKLYGIEGKKDKPDFTRYLPIDYKPTDEEIEYCIQDSKIMAYAMLQEYKNDHKSLTLSSDAFKSVQETLGGFKNWRSAMPQLDLPEDSFVRDSYKGGYVYVNPKYQNKEIENVTVYDVNSLYPYVMESCELPHGKPHMIPDFPRHKEDYLYVVKLSCKFELKEGYLPTIQIKNNPLFLETEYLKECKEDVVLSLTNIDYELFKEHYEVWDEDILGVCFFNKKVGLLKDYIDYWTNIKIQATKEHDYAKRYIAKRYLNSPYGKTGMRPDRINKMPFMHEGALRFENVEEQVEGIYVPYASFVCAQARNITIRSAQKHYDDFVYADTDSLHLIGTDHSGLLVDDVKLGYWKVEGVFEKAKYIRPKTYIHADKNYVIQEIKCSGMPDNLKEQCTWDRFRDGEEFVGKLMQKRVPGGVVLCPTTYKIKKL